MDGDGWMERDGWRGMDGLIEGWIVSHEDSAIFDILNVIVILFVLNCIINCSLSYICNSLVLYYECFQCIPVCFTANFTTIKHIYPDTWLVIFSTRSNP